MRERFASIGTAVALWILIALFAIYGLLNFGGSAVNADFFLRFGAMLSSTEAPAWVQAVGSAGAIIWGVWFWRADRKQKQEEAFVVAELTAGRTLALTTKLQFEAEKMGAKFAAIHNSGESPKAFEETLEDLAALPKPSDTQILQLVPIGQSIANDMMTGIVALEQARIQLQYAAGQNRFRQMPEVDQKTNAKAVAAMLIIAAKQFASASAAMDKFLTIRTGAAPVKIEVPGYET